MFLILPHGTENSCTYYHDERETSFEDQQRSLKRFSPNTGERDIQRSPRYEPVCQKGTLLLAGSGSANAMCFRHMSL